MAHPSSISSLRRTALLAAAATLAFGALLLLGCDGGGGRSTGEVSDTSAPVITAQPVARAVSAGEAVSFTVVATGGGTLTYQWSRDGAAISGATAATYALAAAAIADAGAYQVVVSNAFGSATSDAVSLTVASTPVGETWNLATGANPADLVEGTSFAYTVSIALDTLAITTSSTDLAVGTAAGGVTPITLAGATVVTVTQDAFGLTVDSAPPDGTHLAFALSGAYAKGLTFLSSSSFRLDLAGVAITSADGPAVNVQSDVRAFVRLLAGTTNTLADSSTYSTRYLADGTTAMDLKGAFFSEGAIVLSGTGSLAVTSAKKHALASDGHVRLREGTVTLHSAKKDGLRANDAFVMDGGVLTITTASGAGKGVKVEGKEDPTTPLGFIAINAGTLTASTYDKALTASWESAEDGTTATLADDPDPLLTVNGGTLVISTFGTPYEDTNLADGDDSLSPEGLEAKDVLTINGGDLTITTTDDAINAGSGIVVNGGRIYAKASANDAIDSNGTMTITGGLIVADGAGGAEGGLDCDQNTFKVTGGTFLGVGGRNSSVTRSVTTQNTVSLRNGAAGALLAVRDAAGNVAFAFTVPDASSAMLISSPSLATGTAYTVYTGGTLGAYGEDFHGLYVAPTTHSGGTAGTSFTISSTVTSL